MNPNASTYTPSAAAQRYLAARQSQSAPLSMRPGPVSPPATAQTPPTTAASSQPAGRASSGGGNAGLPMTTAEHLRQVMARRRQMEKSAAAGTSSVSSSTRPPDTPGVSPAPAPTAASAPKLESRRYTRAQLLRLRPAAVDRVRLGPITDVPPFLKVPALLEPLLALPHALEFVDVDGASALVQARHYVSPLTDSRAAQEYNDLRCYLCPVCERGGPYPCAALHEVILNAEKFVLSCPRGPFLMQPREVVWSLVQMALVFEARQSSMRMRLLAEKAPNVKQLITEYLCGEGYHLSAPPVTAHDEWAAINGLLKFDAIRDNRTRVKTDISKRWRKYKTQFEQFVTFFGYRDKVPKASSRNTITPSIKPGMVAALSGDVVAMVLLQHLGFFIPPDYYWNVFPFLREALGDGSLSHDVIRHLGVYFYAKQGYAMPNPIDTTFLRL